MNTPICDFVRLYAEKNPLRLHMPGHKGQKILGFEPYDITEIPGADSLYEADGIIRESEKNAGTLFGSNTFYSTEGSSLSSRAMLFLACLYARERGEEPLIFAGRNAHKVFLSAAALIGFDVEWLYPEDESTYLSCKISAENLEHRIISASRKPTAVYITSPDYLGNEVDIRSLAEVCHKHGVLLLADNAHGAYLKFLPTSRHPIDLGADMCCDSAHKTLPVVTGGAYLHISDSAPEILTVQAKYALSLFGSTSPSYLILQSLDFANSYLADEYKSELHQLIHKIDNLRNELRAAGYQLFGSEELKITLMTKSYGYNGNDFAEILSKSGLVCEYSDPDFIVLMFTTQLLDKFDDIKNILLSVPKLLPVNEKPPKLNKPVKKFSIRQTCFMKSETVDAENSVGRVLCKANVSCPPAVPIVVSGEIIDKNSAECFKYYGINECSVVAE